MASIDYLQVCQPCFFTFIFTVPHALKLTHFGDFFSFFVVLQNTNPFYYKNGQNPILILVHTVMVARAADRGGGATGAIFPGPHLARSLQVGALLHQQTNGNSLIEQSP